MDLWIKTQQGYLVKPNNIKVGTIIYPYIWVYSRIENDSICLGEYKTEERAFEIIDEIQEILKTRFCYQHYVDSSLIYEMPKE